MTKPTKKQLEKFVKLRNKSGFASNMQFWFDAKECGFEPADLGVLRKGHIGNRIVYHWPDVDLLEYAGQLLKPEPEHLTKFEELPLEPT